MSRNVSFCIVALVAALTSAAAAAAELVPPVARPSRLQVELPPHTQGEILIKLRADAPATAVAALHATQGAFAELIAPRTGLHRVRFASSIPVAEMVRRYEDSGLVEYAHPNYVGRILYTPNDPFFLDDGAYDDLGVDSFYHFVLDSEKGWDATVGSSDVVIAMIDTGVDLDHVDLADNVWTNPGEIAGNGIDDDGNGYVDDVHGFDFVGNNKGTLLEVLLPILFDSQDSNPDVHETGNDGWGVPDPSIGDGQDNNFDGVPDLGVAHGTGTASMAAAVVDNFTSTAGMAGGCRIMAVRIADPEGTAILDDIVRGVEYATAAGADVINMSLGYPLNIPGLRDAVDAAFDAGIVVVAASGNGANGLSSPFGVAYPARFPSTLAVGSGTADYGKALFSDFGPELDVMAPGGDADVSTGVFFEVVWTNWVLSIADENAGLGPAGTPVVVGTAGTSLASPLVAGAAALYRSLFPTATPADVYAAVRASAEDMGPAGRDEFTGYGMLNVRRLLGEDDGPTLYLKPVEQTPSGGAPLAYEVIARNGSATAETVQVRGELFLPDGSAWAGNPVLGPAVITLQPGAQRRLTRSIGLDPGAPTGVYELVFTFTDPGGAIVDQDRVKFNRKP